MSFSITTTPTFSSSSSPSFFNPTSTTITASRAPWPSPHPSQYYRPRGSRSTGTIVPIIVLTIICIIVFSGIMFCVCFGCPCRRKKRKGVAYAGNEIKPELRGIEFGRREGAGVWGMLKGRKKDKRETSGEGERESVQRGAEERRASVETVETAELGHVKGERRVEERYAPGWSGNAGGPAPGVRSGVVENFAPVRMGSGDATARYA